MNVVLELNITFSLINSTEIFDFNFFYNICSILTWKIRNGLLHEPKNHKKIHLVVNQ